MNRLRLHYGIRPAFAIIAFFSSPVPAEDSPLVDSLCASAGRAYEMNKLSGYSNTQRCDSLRKLYANGEHSCYRTETKDSSCDIAMIMARH